MEAPVLTCVQFAEDGQTCTQTQWVQPPQSAFPPLSADAGQELGFAVMLGAVVLWASKLPRRGL